MTPRIVLIHAVQVAMAPVQEAFQRLWPEAACSNLLEDALSPDRERDGVLTPAMRQRIGALADYAVSAGAAGVLFTCSAFGAAIEQAAARLPIPVLKPNEAMFAAALERGDRLGMLATFAPAVPGMEKEFDELARQRSRAGARIQTVCVPGAMAALRAGDPDSHNRLLAEAAPRLAGCDAIMLAHFSTARAAGAVASVVPCPVMTSPSEAVTALRGRLQDKAR